MSGKNFMAMCRFVRFASVIFVLLALYFIPYEILRGNGGDVIWWAAIITLGVPTALGAHLAYEDEMELASDF